MSAPLVTVVIPTRNRSDIVPRCLEALLVQTYPAYEVIVVDDASTDDTPEVLARFAEAHPELSLTVLRNPTQRGANPSRNRGIAVSRGSFVAFEDDDCIADSDFIAGLMREFVSEKVGATTGMVEDPDPRNIYDLAFRGTHRVYGKVHATRLVAGNMCVRRELLVGKLDEDRAVPSGDMSVSGRGDEEDLYLKLKADGWEVRVAPTSRVLHEHYYTRKSFFRQAFKGGGSAARMGFKYRLAPRPELLCLAAGHAFAVGSLVSPPFIVPSATCFALFAGATLVYNEIWRKKKTVTEAIKVAPVMIAYYHVRTAGYLWQYGRLLVGMDRLERVDLRKKSLG